MSRILTLFGTRPEIIKLAPVIGALEKRRDLETVNVSHLVRWYFNEFHA